MDSNLNQKAPLIFQFCNSTEKYGTFNRKHKVGRWLIIGKIYKFSLLTTPNHVFYSVSVWRFFIWAWLPCSLGIFWFRSTLFGTTNFVKWTMTQLRLTKPHWLSWKILSPPVFESFLEIWHWVWKIVKSCSSDANNQFWIYESTNFFVYVLAIWKGKKKKPSWTPFWIETIKKTW